MTFVKWLIIATIVTPFPFAAWVHYLRSPDRDPRRLVLTGHRGSVATVVRGVDSYVLARIYLGILTTLFVVSGVESWSYSPVGALILFTVAGYFGVALWLFQIRRIADGTVWLNADGIYQNHHGFEAEVRWGDVVEIVPGPTGSVLDTAGRLTHRRLAPRLWVGKGPQQESLGMLLQLGNIHSTLRRPLIDAVAVWASDEIARQEIGTEAAILRLLGPRDR